MGMIFSNESREYRATGSAASGGARVASEDGDRRSRAACVVVARAPIERVAVFAREKGWRHVRLVSAASNTFRLDYSGDVVDGEPVPMVGVVQALANGADRWLPLSIESRVSLPPRTCLGRCTRQFFEEIIG